MDIAKIIKKNKGMSEPDSNMWSMIMSLVQKEIDAQIKLKENDIENELKTFTTKTLQDIKKWMQELQRKSDQYIEQRKVEIKGNDGYTPIKGLDYDDGKDGYTPKKGVDYFDGEKGDTPEIDFESIYRAILTRIGDIKDKAEEIVSKINTSKEKILISSINGLQEEINGLKRAIREGVKGKGQSGGGMGNTQHESKAISSATTSVTTSYPISANGYALWAYYQGQMIARGVGYTVSTDRKTINLLFTPIDNTYIDLIYIR